MLPEPEVSVIVIKDSPAMGVDVDAIRVGPWLPGVKPGRGGGMGDRMETGQTGAKDKELEH